MICPHCKRENYNEMLTVCEHCNQPLNTQPIVESVVQPPVVENSDAPQQPVEPQNYQQAQEPIPQEQPVYQQQSVPYGQPAYQQPQPIAQEQPKKKNPIVIIAIGVVALLVIIFALGSGNLGGVNFNSLYNEYCDSEWADVGSDGSYLSIDSNPYDIDDYLDYEAYSAIKAINTELSLPESLTNDMGRTSALDGIQTRDFPDQGVSISWKYHPDKGLQVTYEECND